MAGEHAHDGGYLRAPDGRLAIVDGLEGKAGGYLSGVNGNADVPSGHRLVSFTAVAGASAASVVVAGGPAIPIPANYTLDWAPRTVLEAPTVIFDATVSYLVEYAQL